MINQFTFEPVPYAFDFESKVDMPGRIPFLARNAAGVKREASAAADIPVLHLSQVLRSKYSSAFVRKPHGFEAFFCGPLPSPQVSIAIKGSLMFEKNGVRRPVTLADLRKWQPKAIVNRVYTGRGVSASTSPVSRIKRDGTFTTESMIVVDKGTRRIRVQVTLDLKGREIKTEAIFRQSDLDCFLALADSYEGRRPVGRVTGSCQIALGRFEFLSSVRKMFQPAPGSSLSGMFDAFLHRNRKICQLAAVDSAEGRYIRSFEILTIGDDRVDLGHVLVGIEASRRQRPASVLPPVRSDVATEALMTWAGDLGSALEAYAEAIAAGRRVHIRTYLDDKSGFADLLGDIDGINIGSNYDETKSLSENLRAYYESIPFRRFRNYLVRLRDESGKPLLTLAQLKPPKIDQASRPRVAQFITLFAKGVAMKRKAWDKLAQPQQAMFSRMLEFGSPEMNTVLDYFFEFLEKGLARES